MVIQKPVINSSGVHLKYQKLEKICIVKEKEFKNYFLQNIHPLLWFLKLFQIIFLTFKYLIYLVLYIMKKKTECERTVLTVVNELLENIIRFWSLESLEFEKYAFLFDNILGNQK